jgi:hypothetical protein
VFPLSMAAKFCKSFEKTMVDDHLIGIG